ncbi:UNVERIFIED_CONTAM: hypothetical protein H355_014947 [Colinus virginianus]|nr:hypothetical protein H355_014947 [Colinus virginianus]
MKFAVAYTLGNCVGLLGTTFLMGPVRQLQGMAEPSRLVTSCVFAASLFLTLFFSLFLPLPILVIACVCVQWLAYVWYSLSYIPYGQECVLWCMRAVAGYFR